MQFNGSLHLGYSTNIHRGNTWEETFSSLQQATLAVRQQACPADTPYGIGLRLSNTASEELAIETNLDALKRWLDQHNCYVFTINGFPYGNFHETRVKEQVYVPDWQSSKRLDYTKRLFSLLAELLPKGVEGSVNTLPCSFKPWISKPSELLDIQRHLLLCAEHIEALSERYDCDFHLGLEPEPFGYLETTDEMVAFMDSLRSLTSQPDLINRRIGINYDTCHMAIQFETAAESLKRLVEEEIRLSKIHLSSALKVQACTSAMTALSQFNDPIYLHQVVSRDANGQIQRWQDLDPHSRPRIDCSTVNKNGAYTFTCHYTQSQSQDLRPLSNTWRTLWISSPKIRATARILNSKPTLGKSCRQICVLIL